MHELICHFASLLQSSGTCFYNKHFNWASAFLLGVIWNELPAPRISYGLDSYQNRYHHLVYRSNLYFLFLVYPPCLQLADRNRLKETHFGSTQQCIRWFPWHPDKQQLHQSNEPNVGRIPFKTSLRPSFGWNIRVVTFHLRQFYSLKYSFCNWLMNLKILFLFRKHLWEFIFFYFWKISFT